MATQLDTNTLNLTALAGTLMRHGHEYPAHNLYWLKMPSARQYVATIDHSGAKPEYSRQYEPEARAARDAVMFCTPTTQLKKALQDVDARTADIFKKLNTAKKSMAVKPTRGPAYAGNGFRLSAYLAGQPPHTMIRPTGKARTITLGVQCNQNHGNQDTFASIAADALVCARVIDRLGYSVEILGYSFNDCNREGRTSHTGNIIKHLLTTFPLSTPGAPLHAYATAAQAHPALAYWYVWTAKEALAQAGAVFCGDGNSYGRAVSPNAHAMAVMGIDGVVGYNDDMTQLINHILNPKPAAKKAA